MKNQNQIQQNQIQQNQIQQNKKHRNKQSKKKNRKIEKSLIDKYPKLEKNKSLRYSYYQVLQGGVRGGREQKIKGT